MTNGTLITCWAMLILLILWYACTTGNMQMFKINKKPKLDKYIATIHLRMYYGRQATQFESNWDDWEKSGVIWITCYTDQQPNTLAQVSREGKWTTYSSVKVTCIGDTHDIVRIEFR